MNGRIEGSGEGVIFQDLKAAEMTHLCLNVSIIGTPISISKLRTMGHLIAFLVKTCLVLFFLSRIM